MDEHSLRVLELQPVLDWIAGQTHSPQARALVQGLRPAEDLHELNQRQAESREALKLLDLGFEPPLHSLEDVREAIGLAGRGGVLDPVRLRAVRETAVASRKLGRYLEERSTPAPTLADRARWLPNFPRLESEVARCLAPDNRIQDAASSELARIRSEIRSTDSQIGRNLQALLRDADIQKMVQEPIVTVRQGRQVIPVKSEHRGRFPGLVIDASSSGATVFMEPMSVLPLSNQLRALVSAEEHEVESILRSLSGLVAQEQVGLTAAAEELAIVDALFAGATFAKKTDGSLPQITENAPLRLTLARHPLLLSRGVRAVPISLEMGREFKTLVVTGPNTGGKTVALKTVGLLAILAMSGLPIPVEPDSTLPFFDGVWADIGDEQSISQSLSTFSAHLTQILRILPNAGPQALVLLDELGAGTDPSEGAALGVSLLEHLNAAGALTLVTTHLSDLKIYASKAEGFENAAVEFNAETLSPTYRLTVGVPGRSNALLIASGLGLPDSLLRRAREILGKEHVGVETLLDELETERNLLRRRESELNSRARESEQQKLELQARLQEWETQRQQRLDAAAREADEVLREARERSHGLLREFRGRIADLGRQREQALAEARRYLAELRDHEHGEGTELPTEPDELSLAELERLTRPDPVGEEDELPLVTETPQAPEAQDHVDEQARVVARTMEAQLADMQRDLQDLRTGEPAPPRPSGLQPGQRVYSRRYGQEGEVVTVRDGKAEVRLGVVRLSLPTDDLEPVAAPSGGQEFVPDVELGPVTQKVDLRGMSVDEALYELGKAIDAAVHSRSERLEVVHGKGTGTLKNAVSRYLGSHPQVEEQKLGEVYEGGWGVTVVKLHSK